MMRHASTLGLLLLALAAGCQSVQSPRTRVERVQVVEATREGVRVDVRLEVANPNDKPLPLVVADYQVVLQGIGSYAGQYEPYVTVPAQGTQTVTLPAVFSFRHPPAQLTPSYQVQGSLSYQEPGKFRELLTGMEVPLPDVPFAGEGQVLPAASSEAPDRR